MITRLVRIGSLGLAALALAGCPPTKPPEDPNNNATTPIAARVVGIAAGDTCPAGTEVTAVGKWEAKRPFDATTAGALPESMANACIYAWVSSGKPPQRSQLPDTGIVAWSEDPPDVVPLGEGREPRQQKITAGRKKVLLSEMGVAGLTLGDVAPVRIGFPDSSPSWEQARKDLQQKSGKMAARAAGESEGIALATSTHGFNVAWTTAGLACAPLGVGTCFVRPQTELGLPGPGATATRTEFAAAIVALTKSWLASGTKEPFILNLAAGWEPTHNCMRSAFTEKDMQAAPKGPEAPAVRCVKATPKAQVDSPQRSIADDLVYGAILYATCNGALTIAAAGNDMGFAGAPEGPMLPAAWEALGTMPSKAQCEAWFKGARGAGAEAETAPMLHGVYGVAGQSRSLPNARPRSAPRLAAPGFEVVAFPNDPLTFGYAGVSTASQTAGIRIGAGTIEVPPPPYAESRPLTGTSVSAAVTSAAAAVVWAHRPDLSAAQVMSLLYASGIDLRREADVCLGRACGGATVHRVSICRALAAACFPDGAPTGPDLANRKPQFARCPAAPPVCDAEKKTPTLTDPPRRSAEGRATEPESIAMIVPQPGSDPCPECFVSFGQNGSEVAWWFHEDDVLKQAFFDESGATALLSGTGYIDLTDGTQTQTFAISSPPGAVAPLARGLPFGDGSQTRLTPTMTPTSATMRWVGTVNGQSTVFQSIMTVSEP